jgi:hypothetical protein
MGQASTEDRTEEIAENGMKVKLADIIARLRQGRFQNEQAVSQGIVLRVLQELGWDTWDTAVVEKWAKSDSFEDAPWMKTYVV